MQHGGGMVLLSKPTGVTSFAALSQLKRKLGMQRIGHTGTLDRFASGLLIALVGRLTRIGWLITDLPKRYRAVICFGEQTTTLDPSGSVEMRRPLPSVQAVRDAIPNFIGRIQQVPPAYSAVHIDGERASRRARRGEKVMPAARDVQIDSLQLIAMDLPTLTIDVVCGKGTYVRSIARDLAAAAGSCGHLIALRREAIGGFKLEEAVPIDEAGAAAVVTAEEFLNRVDGLEVLQVTPEGARCIRYGQKVRPHFLLGEPSGNQPCALLSGPELLAIMEPVSVVADDDDRPESIYAYRCVLAEPTLECSP